MQACQLANGVKRVKGDPLKGDYQAHEWFAIKLFKLCKRYMLRMFLLTDVMDAINTMQFEDNGIKLQNLLKRYCKFKISWLESGNEPSRMVELFMKYMSKFMQCKNGISAHDSWILEIESCD
jgi:hypothetical protein